MVDSTEHRSDAARDEPWPRELLANLPNAKPARSIPVVDARDLTPASFRRDFVDRCRPCLVRGAVRHWPAFQRWGDAPYLKRRLTGCDRLRIRRKPELELRWRAQVWGVFVRELAEQAAASSSTSSGMSPAEFIDRIADREFLFCYAVAAESARRALAEDLGPLPFLGAAPRPLGYPRWRVFFFGRSYTDWHAHPSDETLMCQFGAPKRVAMLGPDEPTWDAIAEVAREQRYVGAPDPSRYRKFAALEPQTFVVEPGDATYIPPFWWHAVETVEPAESFGATLAYCFRSPVHVMLDPRFPAQRVLQEVRPWPLRAVMSAGTAGLWAPMRALGRALPDVPRL